MFKNYKSLIAAGLALVSLSAGSIFAQASTPAATNIARGGIVMVQQAPAGSWVRNFNPLIASGALPGTVNIIYEPLTIYSGLDGKETPWLATGYKFSSDGKTLTYTLRDGVKWSDGQAFSADDVVFTFQLIKKFPALDTNGQWTLLNDVKKVDDKTVEFDLKDVLALSPTVIGKQRIVPQHVWSSIADPTTYTNDNPVATGPFTEIKNFSDQSYQICANPNYWQTGVDGKPLPYVDCLQYPAYTDNNAANLALINGDLDWVGNQVADIDNTYVAKDPAHNHYWFYPGNPWGFYVNATKKPFDDLKVRQAMDFAIDRNQIADANKAAGYGAWDPSYASGISPKYASFVPQSVTDYLKQTGQGTFNEDKANQILDDAGYKKGSDGFRTMPDGSAIAPFTIQIVNGWTDVVTAAQIISQGFQDIGLNASVVTPDQGTFQANLNNGTFDTSLGWFTWGATPWDFFHNTMDSRLTNAQGVSTGQFQSRVFDPKWNDLLDSYLKATDPAQQKDIAGQLDLAYVQNDVSTLFAVIPDWYEYSTKRFDGWPTKDDPYAQGSPWANEDAHLVAVQLHCVDATSCGQS